MFKRILLLLLALMIFGTVESVGAAEKKGSKTVAQSRKQKKNQRKKLMRSAAILRQEFKKIHTMQSEILRNPKNTEKNKELVTAINNSMKKLAPHLKAAGTIAGSAVMADVTKLVAEGKKLASEPEKFTDVSMLELLQEHQLQQIDKFLKKVSE